MVTPLPYKEYNCHGNSYNIMSHGNGYHILEI